MPSTPASNGTRSDSSASLSNSVRYTPYGRAAPHSKNRSESISSMSAFSPAPSTTSADSYDNSFSPILSPFDAPQSRMSRSFSFSSGPPSHMLPAPADSVPVGMPFEGGGAATGPPPYLFPLQTESLPSAFPPGYRRPHANSSPPVPVGLSNYPFAGIPSSSLQGSPVIPLPEPPGPSSVHAMSSSALGMPEAWGSHPAVHGTIVTPSGRIQPVLARLTIDQGSPRSTIASAIPSSYDTGSPLVQSASSVGSFWTDSQLASPATSAVDPSAFSAFDFAGTQEQLGFDPSQQLSLNPYATDGGFSAGHSANFSSLASASTSPPFPLSASSASSTTSFALPAHPLATTTSIESELAHHQQQQQLATAQADAGPAASFLRGNPCADPALTLPASDQMGRSTPPHGLTLPDLAAARAVEDTDMRTATRANFRESEMAMVPSTLPAMPPSPQVPFDYSLPLVRGVSPGPSATTTPISAFPDPGPRQALSPGSPQRHRHRISPSMPNLTFASLAASSSGQSGMPTLDPSDPRTAPFAPLPPRPRSVSRPVAATSSWNAARSPKSGEPVGQPPLGLSAPLPAGAPAQFAPAPSPGAVPMSKSYSSSMSELSARYALGLSLTREGAAAAAAASGLGSGAGRTSRGSPVSGGAIAGGPGGGRASDGLKVDANGRAVLPL